jgi:hypothetical protein
MTQNTARHDPRGKSGDEDVADPRARQSEPKQGVRPGPRVRQQPGVGPDGPNEPNEPDEPNEREFELIGDNDLGAADLGPAAPNATDPDADSGRVRKIAPERR